MVYNYTKPRAPIAAMYSSPGPCYALPGLVGTERHDPRSVHEKRPAWHFGLKRGKTQDDCSPGPCHLPHPKVFRDGFDSTPHYSLYARHKDLVSFSTPGAGSYSPEKCGEQGRFRHPAYSFGSRTRTRRSDDTPAPNCYTMDSMFTKTVQSRKKQAPCYSMTGRCKIGSFHQDLQQTPGPGTYAITTPDAYKWKNPLFTMTSRKPILTDSTQKPGPGAHAPERYWQHKKNQPMFSFGIKHSQYAAPLILDIAE